MISLENAMPPTPFNGADPSNILAALYRDLQREQVVSLQIRCHAESAWRDEDDWYLVQQVLSHPSVYEAFGISSLPGRIRFNMSRLRYGIAFFERCPLRPLSVVESRRFNR